MGRSILLWAYRRTEPPARAARFGVVVARRHGGAVLRNLFKRRAREAFRIHKPWPRGWDLVVGPKSPGPFPPAFGLLRDDLLDAARKLGVIEDDVSFNRP